MTQNEKIRLLCLASAAKGAEFLAECGRNECEVLLVAAEDVDLRYYPEGSYREVRCVPDFLNRETVTARVCELASTCSFDRIVPLDDYVVEIAAHLREHLRMPGMGDTTARHFRDKLAMRVKAREAGLLVPDFVHVLNPQRIAAFFDEVPGPWLLKPRSEAMAKGIRKCSDREEMWRLVDELGDRRSNFLVERFVPGEIFHVDSITANGEVVFATTHKYGRAPLDLASEGGIFTTRTVSRESPEDQTLEALNRELLAALGLRSGISHTEFIRGYEDGRFYFLETSARVGGANIAELVRASTGVDLWCEWARMEILGNAYTFGGARDGYAGTLLCVTADERPDLSSYDDAEVVWRLEKPFHAGLIVAADRAERVDELLESYYRRFHADFFAG